MIEENTEEGRREKEVSDREEGERELKKIEGKKRWKVNSPGTNRNLQYIALDTCEEHKEQRIKRYL